MTRVSTIGVLLITFVASIAGTQDLSVTYKEGDVQVRDGGSWAALSIGDRLSQQATIQLSQSAYIEIKRGDLRIVISQKGVYSLANVIAYSRTLGMAGVSEAISSILSFLAGGPIRNQSSAGGSRAGDESKTDDSEWMNSNAQVFLDTGKSYLKSGQYREAITQFLQAFDAAAVQELPQVRYCLAYAHSLNSDTRAALKYAVDLQPSHRDERARDFIILKAKLPLTVTPLHRTSPGSLRMEMTYPRMHSAVRSTCSPLLGVGYRGVGDSANANGSLLRVVAMSGESDLGKAAAQLLGNP